MSDNNTEYMGKKLEEIIVTLPFADGTSMECGVYAYFQLRNKDYFALLPFKAPKVLDLSQNFMLYEVQMDSEKNPVVSYIEDDAEYNRAATYFSMHYSK